jgi:hypothetical protein
LNVTYVTPNCYTNHQWKYPISTGGCVKITVSGNWFSLKVSKPDSPLLRYVLNARGTHPPPHHRSRSSCLVGFPCTGEVEGVWRPDGRHVAAGEEGEADGRRLIRASMTLSTPANRRVSRGNRRCAMPPTCCLTQIRTPLRKRKHKAEMRRWHRGGRTAVPLESFVRAISAMIDNNVHVYLGAQLSITINPRSVHSSQAKVILLVRN